MAFDLWRYGVRCFFDGSLLSFVRVTSSPGIGVSGATSVSKGISRSGHLSLSVLSPSSEDLSLSDGSFRLVVASCPPIFPSVG